MDNSDALCLILLIVDHLRKVSLDHDQQECLESIGNYAVDLLLE